MKVEKKKKLFIDSRNGGNGDVWMRLISFYTVAGIMPHLEISLVVPGLFHTIANVAFGDRLIFLKNETDITSKRLVYSSLGMRDLMAGFFKGFSYILPYQRAVIHDKKKKQLKDRINTLVFNFAAYLGLVHIPAWKWITTYQGYLDIIGISDLKRVSYEDFVQQLNSDGVLIDNKLKANLPFSPQLKIPGDLHQNVLVFPTGTSRQFIPTWWAIKYLPDAYFAFFYKDKDAVAFEKAGLKTVLYYHEPGDIILLARKAIWTISTDSFSSHLLQSAIKNCTITITEVLKSRIISPVFKGVVVDSRVTCHPCLHLDRKNHPLCAAGYSECANWKDETYSIKILESLSATLK